MEIIIKKKQITKNVLGALTEDLSIWDERVSDHKGVAKVKQDANKRSQTEGHSRRVLGGRRDDLGFN